jgi:hypothetical protein
MFDFTLTAIWLIAAPPLAGASLHPIHRKDAKIAKQLIVFLVKFFALFASLR